MRTITRTVLATVLATSSLAAQDLTVRSSSTVRFYGALGKMTSLAARLGGKNMNDPIPGTTYLSGLKMRSETGDNAAVFDLDAGRLINIDNKARSYTSMTFEELAAMMKGAGDSIKASRARDSERGKPSDAKGDVDMKYQVKVDRPGEHAKIAGADAERVFMTITMTANVTPEGEKTQEAGSTIFLVDEWVSKNASYAAAMRDFQNAYMKKLGQEFQSSAKSLEAAFSSNPQLKDGFAAAAKERRKVQGISLRSTTYVVFVPAGMTFDRDLALNEAAAAPPAAEEGKKKGGLRGMMSELKKMSDDADKKGSQPATPPKQGTMMTVKSEVESIESGRLDASLFGPPAGYKEIKPRGSN